MECFLSFGMLVAIIVLVVGFASKAQSRADRWNRAYQALAQRYGGACLPAGWFSRPSVRFQYGPTHVLLNTIASSRGNFTQIHISWPDPSFRLEVFSRRPGPQPKPFRGMHEVAVGSQLFDEHYVVRSNNPAEAVVFLSEGVQWQINRICHFAGVRDLYLSLQRGRLLIKKPVLIRRFEELEEFTHLSMELFDQAMLTRSVGIEFMDEMSVQVIQEATCQICGDSITSDMVFCRRCKTPHHQECWQYYGSCAVYGCQESRFITPRLAGPPRDA